MISAKKREYNRRYRASAKGRARINAFRNRNKKLIRERAIQYRMEHPCACGEADPAALDFHHKDASKKYKDVGRMLSVGGWSWERVAAEIAKCIVICSNCHRKGNVGRPRPEHAPYFPAALWPYEHDTVPALHNDVCDQSPLHKGAGWNAAGAPCSHRALAHMPVAGSPTKCDSEAL